MKKTGVIFLAMLVSASLCSIAGAYTIEWNGIAVPDGFSGSLEYRAHTELYGDDWLTHINGVTASDGMDTQFMIVPELPSTDPQERVRFTIGSYFSSFYAFASGGWGAYANSYAAFTLNIDGEGGQYSEGQLFEVNAESGGDDPIPYDMVRNSHFLQDKWWYHRYELLPNEWYTLSIGLDATSFLQNNLAGTEAFIHGAFNYGLPGDPPPPAVPEPATMILFGTGLLGLAVARRKFKK